MTIIEIIDAFVFYGVDVIAISAATSVLVQILKSTVLKHVQNKIYTFLPFVIGTLLYAVYISVCNLDYMYFLHNYVEVLEHGLSVGALSTLIYVLYEQFVREKENLSATEGVIATLIEGYVIDENVESAAKLIAEAIAKDVTGTGASKTAEILKNNSSEDVSENDLQLLAKLIIETLASLSAK